MVPAAGVEPATFRSGGERSNPLSYAGRPFLLRKFASFKEATKLYPLIHPSVKCRSVHFQLSSSRLISHPSLARWCIEIALLNFVTSNAVSVGRPAPNEGKEKGKHCDIALSLTTFSQLRNVPCLYSFTCVTDQQGRCT